MALGLGRVQGRSLSMGRGERESEAETSQRQTERGGAGVLEWSGSQG